ncbi:hypothetical protein [Mycolicibacterium hippocampi]|uniref:Uncharacterized protein n=1 Tax=Mycolicibacterium hippocampi TaxID=659824 RepID=A0A850PPL9_9MYCO|nr:hypothetical protein [Mycolicibacterium hippocampi]NVN52269.1 hypothetical protein [Mycolicibacterium hippocampi]
MPRPRFKPGDQHPNWRGDDASYFAIHYRLRSARGSARDQPCVDCGQPARHWSYSGDCPSEKPRRRNAAGRVISPPYCTHPNHYEPRCISCHHRHDGAVERLNRKHVAAQEV